MQDQNNIIVIVFGLMLLINVATYCGGLLQHNQMQRDYKALLKLLQDGPPTQTTIATINPVHLSTIETGQREITVEGRVYSSPKLFAVIDWLDANPDKRDLTVRDIASLTGVSKSWVAIAKKHNAG